MRTGMRRGRPGTWPQINVRRRSRSWKARRISLPCCASRATIVCGSLSKGPAMAHWRSAHWTTRSSSRPSACVRSPSIPTPRARWSRRTPVELGRAARGGGRAFLGGAAPDVGVVGYTVGGGLGWLGRRYGFACNRVTAIELVTAAGECKLVDDEHDPDLFSGAAWRRRGARDRRRSARFVGGSLRAVWRCADLRRGARGARHPGLPRLGGRDARRGNFGRALSAGAVSGQICQPPFAAGRG